MPDQTYRPRTEILTKAVEITLQQPEDFLKVIETISRIGIAVEHDVPTLYQSVHLLHKRGQYFLLHFKELLMLDGGRDDFSPEDERRRNLIAYLLEQWGLLKIVGVLGERAPMSAVRVLSYHEKSAWKLVPKYQMGRKWQEK